MKFTLTLAAVLMATLMFVGCKTGDHGHGHDHGAKACCGDNPAACCGKEACAKCESKKKAKACCGDDPSKCCGAKK